MSIESIKLGAPPVPLIQNLTERADGTSAKKTAGSFGEMFSQSIKELDQMQLQADKKIEGLTTKTNSATPHDAMIALEKADIAFQLMNQIRGKIIRAYEEILRTQI